MRRTTITTFTLALGLACSSDPGTDDEAGTTTSPSTTNADSSSSDDDESTSESTSEDDEPTVGTSSDNLTGFIDTNDTFEDGHWGGDPCDSFAQDCPEGEKCVPYASSGGIWDALKCVPINGDQAAGEPCTYSGPADSQDDCDGTSWCWDVDDMGNGVCHPFCTGTPDVPECPPMSECTISGDGVINICIGTCEPLLQTCDEGDACYWTGSYFGCVFTAGQIPTGEPCGFINDCVEGNMCIDAAALPGCNGSACCTIFCDLQQGDAPCGVLPGTVCIPFFEQGRAPLGYEQVGVCALPP